MNRRSEFFRGRIIYYFFFLIFLFEFVNSSSNEYGVLAAESSSEKENFCIIYFKDFVVLPNEKSKAEFHILEDDSKLDWCQDHPEKDPKSKVLLLSKGNCSISSQALNVQDRGGKGILFITRSGAVGNYNVNNSEGINITVGLISEKSAERLTKMDNTITVRLFAPDNRSFDFSLLAIWFIAMFTIFVGSYWSGHVRFAIYCQEVSVVSSSTELPNKPYVKVNTKEDSSINIPAFAVAMFVVCMGLMLLLLYFFFDYLVYFIIGLFVLASILSVYSCLEPWIMRIPDSFCKSNFRCGSCSCRIDFRQVILVSFAIAISVFWVIVRKEKYAWILQDVLGVMFCIHMLKSIRLSSLKTCAVLLVLLFFYDIFFVFITPFLTVKGESVMEEVATGGKSSEMLPMVLKVAHFGFDPISACYQQFSILGFGDILVPGLLVSYCHGYDLITSKRKIYFLMTFGTYGIGLLITFVGLFLMSTAQPALLYLVPCTLLPPVILGCCRGELQALWNGFPSIQPTTVTSYPDVQVAANASVPEVQNVTPAVSSKVDNQVPKETVRQPEYTTDERNYLLH